MAKQSISIHDVADEGIADEDQRKGASSATAPASQPDAAVAQPASTHVMKAAKPSISSVRDPKINFEDDPAIVLKGMSVDKQADMIRTVHCHVVETFAGRTPVKGRLYHAFKFYKHEVVMLPKWFAMAHPTRLVIKE